MKTNLLILAVVVIFASGCGGRAALSMPPNQQEIDAAKAVGSPVAVSAIFGERGYASGISVMMTWKNISVKKTIKYCWFSVEFINKVGDVVASDISEKKVVSLEATGPFPPGKTSWGGLRSWENAFYHPNASVIRLRSVQCEYMDGEKTADVQVASLPTATGEIGSKP